MNEWMLVLGWCWIYEREESECIIGFCAGIGSRNIRAQNTAYAAYNLYQSVAVTMQQLMSIFKYIQVHWIQCDD